MESSSIHLKERQTVSEKMGNCCDSFHQSMREKDDKQKVNLLLVGGGESGKSTIIKQLRILYGEPWTEEELRLYGLVIRSNVVTAIRKLCQLLRDFELEDQLAEESAPEESKYGISMTPKEAFDLIVAHVLDKTAANEADLPEVNPTDWVGEIKKFHDLNKDARYCLQLWKPIRILWEDLPRIASPSFKPNNQDILYARRKTTVGDKHRYFLEHREFNIIDVGGQRKYRKHWRQHFSRVDAVIMVAALSGYDQKCEEAKRMIKMTESLNIFSDLCRNEDLFDKPIILFLNKKDVFEEKIAYSGIPEQAEFSDYTGLPNNYKDGLSYFVKKFKDCKMGDEIDIRPTVATDTQNMKFIWDSTHGIIMNRKMEGAGLLP